MLKKLKINVGGCVSLWAIFYFMIVCAGAHVIPRVVLVAGSGNLMEPTYCEVERRVGVKPKEFGAFNLEK